jgi:uncharacterized SAM-binding protein YcdF (DUF218 family)
VRVVGAASLLALLTLAIFLPFAGRALVKQDPLVKSDAIVALPGVRAHRLVEAVDLYREGWAPQVIVLPGPMENIERDLKARGVRIPLEGEITRDAMIRLGVPPEAIVYVDGAMDNTAEEAAMVKDMALARGWRTVIVVTSKYHTRRSGLAFRREFAGTPLRVIVRASRHDPSNPARWWRSRSDVRFVTAELPKLLAYWLGAG